MKILIVKLHAIGDLVIASPAIRRLRESIPNARIDLLTTVWTAPAMMNNPQIDTIFEARDALFFKPGIGTIFETIKLINDIRRRQYNAAIVFHVHKGIDYFLSLTGIRKRFKFSSNYDNESIYLDPNRHSALTACELVDYAIYKLTNNRLTPSNLRQLRYEWIISDEENSQALSILNSVGIRPAEFTVLLPGGGINPGVVDTVRRWKVSGFAEVAEYVNEQYDLTPVLLGSSSDRMVCAKVSKLCRLDCINWAGSYDMRISAAIMSHARLVVTNDSGPLHVAAAVGVPVVGVFGPTGPELKLPPGTHVHAAQLGIPCSPCYFGRFRGCIFDNIKCFEELHSSTVKDAVSKAIENLLQAVN